MSDNRISLSANDVKLIREQDFFNCKDFHLFIYNKVESATGCISTIITSSPSC